MRTFVLLLALAGVAWAAPPKAVKLEVTGDTVTVVRSFPVRVTAAPGADIYVWQFPDGVKGEAVDGVLTVTAAPKGVHRVTVTSLTFVYDEASKKWQKTRDTGEATIVVGDVPAPPGPTPPEPGPKPPAPDGPFRVLMVYESAELASMPAKQQEVLFSRKVRDWLNAKCAPDGDRKAWRIWDKDTDATADGKHWQDYLKRPRAAVPFLHAFRGDKAVHEGPLPDDAEAALLLLERIEGGK